MILKKSLLFLTIYLLFFAVIGHAQKREMHPKNEFRAVWIATVVNIDWPKSSTDSVEKQKTDYIEILDTYQKLNYNAVIVQIRSVGDALYPTILAPWSRYLTGREGKAPSPNYDVLEWMISEAHARGFEFHAWLNPYRATFDLKTEALSLNHDYYKHPEWMIEYGGKYYYNPALPEVQQHLTSIVEEVVIKYDIDAIHFDDYFYPYKIKGIEFNDAVSYQKFGKGLSIADWRRSNVSTFVRNISLDIKKLKPWVQFGISPFGVWRNKSVDPKGSDTSSGQTNYDDLYADPLDWMKNNWIDYIVPQLYWSIDHKTASYAKLIKWWSENVPSNTALYVGNSTYKIKADSDKHWNNKYEIPNQIDLTRSYDNVQGNGFFSAKWFINKNQEVVKVLKDYEYKYPALPLPVPNFKKAITESLLINSITKDTTNYYISFQKPKQLTKVRYIVVYGAKDVSKINTNDASQILDKIAVTEENGAFNIEVPDYKMIGKTAFAFTFVDYYANESPETIIDLQVETQTK
ncbi:glycoside hydrolase family 10 protein [Flavobacterium taihuense]|uniref:Family 10 glycosylhydrolase n=1 Tax=Flavobacterium taihuense TaxID=2857508 RepID=A0ABS6XWF5_9FLAO|nr:family 10 glycosylhydrolase [Flavobacterium taihuense]MBW4361005.1 family 10 glycosylhydrolase [Flavobacterium taihuense]